MHKWVPTNDVRISYSFPRLLSLPFSSSYRACPLLFSSYERKPIVIVWLSGSGGTLRILFSSFPLPCKRAGQFITKWSEVHLTIRTAHLIWWMARMIASIDCPSPCWLGKPLNVQPDFAQLVLLFLLAWSRKERKAHEWPIPGGRPWFCYFSV